MLNKILYAPGVSKNELIETISKFSNKKEFMIGLRIMGTSELAKYILMKNGVTINKTFISSIEEEMIISKLAKSVEFPFFASSTLKDSKNIVSSLNSMRMLLRGDDSKLEDILSKGTFIDKNKDIYGLYKAYLNYLENHKQIDGIELTNIAINLNNKIDEEIYTLSQFELKPLEETLVKSCFVKAKEISLTNIIGESYKFKIASYTKCYGATNEIQNVLNYISKNNLAFDECLICALDSSYSKRFYDMACDHNIPITIGSGLPIYASNPGKLLKLIYDWETTGYHGLVSLNKIIDSECFNREKLINDLSNGDNNKVRLNYITPIVGHLRLSFDSIENDKLFKDYLSVAKPNYNNDYAMKFKDILNKGLLSFLKEYSIIKNTIDNLAILAIEKLIYTYLLYEGKDIYEMVPIILNRIGWTDDSCNGCLHLCDLNSALSYLRKNIFIVGMGSKNFPGNPKEDYILLDCDYDLFNEPSAPTSNKVVENNKKMLFNLLDVATSINANIHLSYSYFNLSDIKDENASSVLFEIYRKENGEGVAFKDYEDMIDNNDVGFFDAPIDNYYKIGKSYIDGKKLEISEKTVEEIEYDAINDHGFSPTEIESYFNCPYAFYLKRMLKLKEKADEDPFENLTAADTGTLAHSLMEELDKNVLTKDAFLQKTAIAYDDFDKIRNSIQKSGRGNDKEHFLEMMEEAYDQDPGNQVIIKEDKQDKTLHSESGVWVTGQPDRVEITKDGKYIVVDFKTKNSLAHLDDDPATCIQVLMYAYLVEKNNPQIKIDHCEYRYFKLGQTVNCVYKDEMKIQLAEKLNEFRTGVISGKFNPNKGDNCRYCKYKSFCGGVVSDEEDSNEGI